MRDYRKWYEKKTTRAAIVAAVHAFAAVVTTGWVQTACAAVAAVAIALEPIFLADRVERLSR